MARKRINVKFIGIGGGIVLTAAAGVVVAKKMMHAGADPAQLQAEADNDLKSGNFPEAADILRQIAGMQPKNAAVHLELAKTTYMMGEVAAKESLEEFVKTEEIDPDNKEAWAGVLQGDMRFLTYLEGRQSRREDEDYFLRQIPDARAAAAHLLALDPNDPTAIAAVPEIDLRMWMMKFAIPLTPEERKKPLDQQPTDQQKADDAMLALTQLLKRHSPNEQIPYWLARAKLYKGQDLQRTSQIGGENNPAAPLFAEAAAVFDDAITANPTVLKLYLCKAEILNRLMSIDLAAAPQADYKRQYRECLTRADQLANIKTSREDYFRTKFFFAQSIAETDQGHAETLLTDLIKQFPERPQISIALAKMIKHDPSRIQNAIDVLDKVPSVAPASMQLPDQLRYWDQQYAENRLERASIQIDQMDRIPPSQARLDKGVEIEKALATAKTRYEGKPEYLLALGKYQSSIGQTQDAINTLTTGMERLNATGQRNSELLVTLAWAYQKAAQPDDAVKLYRAAIQNDPTMANDILIHNRLAQVLIAMHRYEQARPELDWLSKRTATNDPALVQLQLEALGKTPDPAVVADLVSRLSEKTDAEVRLKANISLKYGGWTDAIRLCRQLADANPTDPLFEAMLVAAFFNSNKTAEGQAELDAAIQKFPDDQPLKAEKIKADAIFGTGSPTALSDPDADFAKQLAEVQKISDPFTREVSWADLDQMFNRVDEELEHCQKAAALQPNNIDTNQTLFLRYLQAQRFSEASAMMPHLTEINADQAKGNILRVRLALAQGDAAQAVTLARQLVEDNPNYWISFQTLGAAYQMAGQYDLAVQQYTTALQKQPANADVLRSLILCEVAQNKLGEARRYILQARRQFPEDPSYLNIEVVFECQHGDPEPLLAPLSDTVKKYPGNQNGYALYADALAATYQLHIDRGEGTAAQPFLDDLIATRKEANKRWPVSITFAEGLADALTKNKDFKGAEAVILATAAQPKWKDQPTAQYMVGNFYFNRQKFDSAEPYLRKTVELAPMSAQAHVLLADDLWHQDKQDDALRVIKPVILQNIEAFRKYDQWLVKMNRGDQAESETNGALATYPKNAALNDLLIEVYSLNQKPLQAIELAKKVIHDDPRNVMANLWLGRLLSGLTPPDVDGAIRNVTIFSSAHPDDVAAHMDLGMLHEQKDERDEAIQEFLIASRLAPQDRRIRLVLLQSYMNSPTDHKADALSLVTELLKMQNFAEDPDFLRTAATLWAQSGENLKAIVAINKAVAAVKDKYGPERDLVMADFLRVLRLTKRNDDLVNEASRMIVDPRTTQDTVGMLYSFRARGKAGQGDTAGAVDDFKIALDKAGTDPGQIAPVHVAQELREQLGTDKAVELIKPRADNSLLWKLVMINLYQTAKDFNHASEYAELALKDDQSLNVNGRRNITRAAANLALLSTPPKYNRAAELYREVLKDSPDDIASMNDLATTLDDSPDQSNPKEALKWSTMAFDLMAQKGIFNSRIYDTQGWTLILNNQIDDGLDVLHKACDHATLPDAHYHLAEGYLKEKHPEDASRELVAAMTQLQEAIKAGDTYDSSLTDKINAASVEAERMTKEMAAKVGNP